jgi:hypothetical protein
MKKKSSGSQNQPGLLPPPAFPLAGNELFQRVGAAVVAARGYGLKQKELARLMGRSETTTSAWFGGVSPQPHLIAWFCLLEQLSASGRHRLIDELCRDLPLLDHARLNHNPETVGALKILLAQPTGLTCITGGTAEQRTFLLTAMGHSFVRSDSSHRSAVGLDIHEPRKIVPIETMSYVKPGHHLADTQAVILRAWPDLRATKAPLLLFNGVWSVAPSLRTELLALASQRHVILADQEIGLPRGAALAAAQPVHLLKLTGGRAHPAALQVEIQRV